MSDKSPTQTTEPPVWDIEISFYETDVKPETLLDEVSEFILTRYPGFSGVIGMRVSTA